MATRRHSSSSSIWSRDAEDKYGACAVREGDRPLSVKMKLLEKWMSLVTESFGNHVPSTSFKLDIPRWKPLSPLVGTLSCTCNESWVQLFLCDKVFLWGLHIFCAARHAKTAWLAPGFSTCLSLLLATQRAVLDFYVSTTQQFLCQPNTTISMSVTSSKTSKNEWQIEAI